MSAIIVVEDEALILEMYVEILEMSGYQVRPFLNGDQAWEYIENSGLDPRLLITDLQMPGHIDGLGLIQRVRKRSPCTPIIAVSGYHSGSDLLNHLEVYWLPKPFGINELTSICETLAPQT
ncbi:response regulator [Pseudomonas sp. CFSAN084952]|uniref:response regulator transcription factor n=1 Tax=Pseudomonas TaxID=286 RepID=UPI001299B572|nr:response regulator [Pseudomonas sp. CFSAN084952]QGF91775.1 response regulator [Pseudomonas sp. CFSAN084952]